MKRITLTERICKEIAALMNGVADSSDESPSDEVLDIGVEKSQQTRPKDKAENGYGKGNGYGKDGGFALFRRTHIRGNTEEENKTQQRVKDDKEENKQLQQRIKHR